MSASCKLLQTLEKEYETLVRSYISKPAEYFSIPPRAMCLHSIILRKVHSSWLSSATCWGIEKLISERQSQQHHGVWFDQRKRGLSYSHSHALRHEGRKQLRSSHGGSCHLTGGRSFAICLGFPGEIPIDNANGSWIQLFWEWNWLKLWEFGQQIAILHN